jgi:hypothetical protein
MALGSASSSIHRRGAAGPCHPGRVLPQPSPVPGADRLRLQPEVLQVGRLARDEPVEANDPVK